jgi:hypothetical protein
MRNLPVAAYPTVATAHVHAVARWVLLLQLDVAQQPSPRIAPFQKIVAEDQVLGKTSLD